MNSTPLKSGNQTLVVIDPQLEGAQSLVEGVIFAAKILILNPHDDGVEQITEALRDNTKINCLHILAPGRSECLYLGSSELKLDNLEDYRSQFQSWFQGVVCPEILIYGCCVPVGNAGSELIEKLHQLTGAAVAASRSLTSSGNKMQISGAGRAIIALLNQNY